MKNSYTQAVISISLLLFTLNAQSLEVNEPKGCIVSLDTGDKYCLSPGENSGYSLPTWIRSHNVYVQAAEGTSVTLSDWDNLSYNRTASFEGTTSNSQLENVMAANGQRLDFSNPRSMRVAKSNSPLGCIISRDTSAKFCLVPGGNSGYSLPDWIRSHDVYVQAAEGTSVTLSDWDALSYSRTASFEGTTSNSQLENVMAANGQRLDFSNPRSMRVAKSGSPLGCIVSRNTGAKFCLAPGGNSGYSLPDWIRSHDVYVQATQGSAVILSDWDNLSYSRIASFKGTTANSQLKNVMAANCQVLDFSNPRSMKVVENNELLSCIVSKDSGAKFCLAQGDNSGYSLPDWIRLHDFHVQAAKGSAVTLSDWDNLSYNRLASFIGNVANVRLKNVKAANGQMLDFSKPRSMRVIKSTIPTDNPINFDYTIKNSNLSLEDLALIRKVLKRCILIFGDVQFQEYILTAARHNSDDIPLENRGEEILKRMQEGGYDISMLYSTSTAGWADGRRIALNSWVFDKYRNGLNPGYLPGFFTHELLHNLGYGHIGIPYPVGNKMAELYMEKYANDL